MRTVDYVIVGLFGVGYLLSFIYLFYGVKNYLKGNKEFNLSMMFKNIPFNNSSGGLLIVEGLSFFIMAIALNFVWIKYLR